MKAIFTILILLTGYLVLPAQTILQPAWVKTAVGANGGKAEAWGIDVDDQGSIYWGVSIDNLGQGLDIEVYKFDAAGIPLWSVPFFYGGPGAQQAYVLHAQDTALYVGGRNCPFLVNTCDMLLLKVDKTNATLNWDRTLNFSGNGYDEVDGLVARPDGIYCGGWAHELESGIFNADIGLWKLDYAGNTIWTNHFGTGGGFAEHQDGHFVVDDDYIYAAGLWGGDYVANLYNGHAFLGRFDKTNGNFVDSTLFGAQSAAWLDIENALGMASDGDFLYITGYATPVAANDWQLFVAKYDKNLNQIWYTDWGGSGTESARAIAVQDGIVYVGGLSASPSIMTGGGDRDAVLLKLDTSGTILSYQTWGDTLMNSFLDLAVEGGDVYLTGITEQDTFGLGRTGFMLKAAGVATGAAATIAPVAWGFRLFPNPAYGRFSITFNRPVLETGSYQIRDVTGKLVQQASFPIGTERLDLELTQTGAFLVTVDFGSYRISRKLINGM